MSSLVGLGLHPSPELGVGEKLRCLSFVFFFVSLADGKDCGRDISIKPSEARRDFDISGYGTVCRSASTLLCDAST